LTLTADGLGPGRTCLPTITRVAPRCSFCAGRSSGASAGSVHRRRPSGEVTRTTRCGPLALPLCKAPVAPLLLDSSATLIGDAPYLSGYRCLHAASRLTERQCLRALWPRMVC